MRTSMDTDLKPNIVFGRRSLGTRASRSHELEARNRVLRARRPHSKEGASLYPRILRILRDGLLNSSLTR